MQKDKMFVTVKELAKELGVKVMTIRKLIDNGVLPKPVKLTSHVVFWKTEEITQWLNNRG